ncbi:sigma-54 dependent transcriptional regulator [Vibrio maerlii]|uniref:sigma-54 dependent transcriptional regulator n=1 Tax=Vibrio maerlii TaxID=2231648 RepID=UPI000E3D4E35|nr:sigma-54 dependent transcriptional regulator [Vibrio maerlii]
MKQDRSVSIIVLSSHFALWSDFLCKYEWRYKVLPVLSANELPIHQAERLVLVIDFSCDVLNLTQLEAIARHHPSLRIIAYLDKEQRAKLTTHELGCISRYCVDFYTSPLPEYELSKTLGHQVGIAQLETTRAKPGTSSSSIEHQAGALSGQSIPIVALNRQILRVAPADVNILIRGESGTGKELIARALHQASKRKNHPFIAVNCGGLNENLVHSELFGHEKGAFTGANKAKPGKVALADKGTLFLDEIGDLPLSQQANLLRFLQEGVIDSLGSHKSQKVDVRVLAATHVNLEQAIEQGKFREDLYYRLNVVTLTSPPLRERGDDILLLAEQFKHQFVEEFSSLPLEFSEEAKLVMLKHGWSGNVRELINVIKRAVLMCEGDFISSELLELSTVDVNALSHSHSIEKEQLLRALRNSGGTVVDAARLLGVSRATMYRLLKKHDLNTALQYLRKKPSDFEYQS